MSEQNPPAAEQTVTQAVIDRAKQGDREAMSELYKATELEIYRTIHAMIRDEDLVLDVQQDCYLKAFSRLDQLRDASAFLPWLRQIAVNEAKSQLRKKKPLLFSELSDEEEAAEPELPDIRPEASPELALDRKETARLVHEILDRLTDSQRLMMGMYYYEQIPVREIADELGLKPGTVKSQLHRSRKLVEDEVRKLEARGVKLYGLSPLPFLLALLKRAEPAEEAGGKAMAAVLREKGAEAVGVHVGRRFFETAAGKLLLGLITVGVIGGGVAGWRWLQKRAEPLGDLRPTIRAESAENITTEPSDSTARTTEPPTTEPTDPEVASTGPESPAPSQAASPTAESEPSDGASEQGGGETAHVLKFTWSNSSSAELYDQPLGSTVLIYAATTIESSSPKVYTDNEKVVRLKSLGEYHRFVSNTLETGYSWEATFLGSGTAHVYCESGGTVTNVLTVTNPEHPEQVLKCSPTYGDGEIQHQVGQWGRFEVLVQGLSVPELSTDNSAVLQISYKGPYYSNETDWIHKGYFWDYKALAPGTAHVYIRFNGSLVKTYTITVAKQAPQTEPPVTNPPVTNPLVTEPPVTAPPVTEPPVTEPPVTAPPVTEPLVTEPPNTESPDG